MSSRTRSPIPSIGTPPLDTPSRETLELITQRLESAEQDTKHLAETLSTMGFNNNAKTHKSTHPDVTVTPFKARSSDPETLHRNYEGMVARLCKTESTIQSLKQNLLRAKAERDATRKEKMMVTEKLANAADAYEKELKRLNKELTGAKVELREALDARSRTEEEVIKLENALKTATSSQSHATLAAEEMKNTKSKQQRRINEMKEELSREASMRASLEESNRSLMNRVKELEGVVEKERGEVKTLAMSCTNLKQDSVQARGDAEQLRHSNHKFEKFIKQLTYENEAAKERAKAAENDKLVLLTEVDKMKKQYKILNTQLDKMQKLFHEKKATHQQLEQENKKLYDAMKNAAAQNAQIISKYEHELENERVQTANKAQQEENLEQITQQLKLETREKAKLEQKIALLEKEIAKSSKTLKENNADNSDKVKLLESKISELNGTVQKLEEEKERVLRDKESLLDEVNQAVDSMSEERSKMENEMHQTKLDMQGLQYAKEQLQQENGRLLEKMAAMEEQQNSHKQVEGALEEMIEQKNKLAYDKGRLQSKVESLQKELENMATTNGELGQLKKVSSALEARYQKVQADLSNNQIAGQRLESQLAQSKANCERKEHDFNMAIKARDEALKETTRLKGHIEAVEEREKKKVADLQKNLSDARESHKKVASTLESIMQSHGQLQNTVEDLQVKLGKKDTQIDDLRSEREELQHQVRELVKETEDLQAKLQAMELQETMELEPLRKAFQLSKEDNGKIANSLESLLEANDRLQRSTQGLQNEIETKTHLLEQTQRAREKEKEEHCKEIRNCEERLANLKKQLAKERDASIKKSNSDVKEMRRELECLVSKNGDLARCNAELRHKVMDLEYLAKEYRESIENQKREIDHLKKMRQKQELTLESLSGVGDQLGDLERTKREYMKKNDEQSQTIRDFMKQIQSLQSELNTLSQLQHTKEGLIKDKDEIIRRERSTSEDLRKKNKVSGNLQEAHDWFKSKFNDLQTELGETKHSYASMTEEAQRQQKMIEAEKEKARQTAERAKEMLKASRETINKLSIYAEAAQKDTCHKMAHMRKQIKAEKDHSRYTEKKYKEFQDSSLRHAEELAKELDYFKTHSLLHDTSS